MRVPSSIPVHDYLLLQGEEEMGGPPAHDHHYPQVSMQCTHGYWI